MQVTWQDIISNKGLRRADACRGYKETPVIDPMFVNAGPTSQTMGQH